MHPILAIEIIADSDDIMTRLSMEGQQSSFVWTLFLFGNRFEDNVSLLHRSKTSLMRLADNRTKLL
jgi:hypothetical protein